VVLVEGGTNDELAASEQITGDAASVFNAIKAQVPQDTLVVAVGPIRTPKKDPDNLARVAAAISQAASETDVRFIDPVGEHWVDDESLFFDAYHPNAAGYTDFARHLTQDIQELGATSDC
jgi:lysophospholipase L1-like esterase